MYNSHISFISQIISVNIYELSLANLYTFTNLHISINTKESEDIKRNWRKQELNIYKIIKKEI